MTDGFAAISVVARVFEDAGWSHREASEWEAAHIVKLSKLRKAQQSAEIAARMRFVAEVKSLGTRIMAERKGVTPQAIRKERSKCLEKIATAAIDSGCA